MSIGDYFQPGDFDSVEGIYARFRTSDGLGAILGCSVRYVDFSACGQGFGLYVSPNRKPSDTFMTGDCTFCQFDKEENGIAEIKKITNILVESGTPFEFERSVYKSRAMRQAGRSS